MIRLSGTFWDLAHIKACHRVFFRGAFGWPNRIVLDVEFDV